MNRQDEGSRMRISTLAGWILVYLCIIGIVVTVVMYQLGYTSDDSTLGYTFPIGIMAATIVLLYIVLVLRSILSDTLVFLKDKKTATEALNNIQNGRLAMPYVTIKITCADYNRSGKGVSLERCVDIPIVRCVDASGDINPTVFQQGQFTRVSAT